MLLGPPRAHTGASKGPKEAKIAIILIFLISWIHLHQFESVAWQWSHMKDKLMQIIQQFEKNDAGAPMGPLRGPKGTQKSRNVCWYWQKKSLQWNLLNIASCTKPGCTVESWYLKRHRRKRGCIARIRSLFYSNNQVLAHSGALLLVAILHGGLIWWSTSCHAPTYDCRHLWWGMKTLRGD